MAGRTRSDTRILGTLRTEGGKGTVRVADRYDTKADDLWTALTDPDRLSRWIARVEGDLALGGAFHARFTSGWEGPGRVEVCEPPRRLLVRLDPGLPDETVVEALLTPDGDRTHLVVEERGLPLDEYADHGAGWQAHIEDLATHLTGAEPADWRTRWIELRPPYEVMAKDPA